ncbi:MAG: Na/Pi cotransporter family protein [Bryobacterales bacterium]|nr:Na/Pi cotransporter family protein [Bryobacterales bacterium]
MTGSLFALLGGIGLFLLGMTLLTDGLKSLAGDSLRRALVRFTGKPRAAFTSGVLATALVQSSSATTVTMIGFVSAGLLSFPQALGVILGASLGTTSTGWLVSGLGLKVSIGQYALPVVGIGAFIRLLAPLRWRALGIALAGFGLIFVGIETLQTAMQGASTRFDFNGLPSGVAGMAVGVALGVVMTVVLQSSSAAIAAVLTALHTGSIAFENAALFVIGAHIGTTVTGALAAIGASIPAKRTALALVLFNTASGTIALLLLPVFFRILMWAQQDAGLEPGAMSLAAFHTLFTAVGVAILFPFIPRFARRVERLLPEPEDRLTGNLDNSLHSLPGVALEALRRALRAVAAHQFQLLREGLAPGGAQDVETRRGQTEDALVRAEEFFARIPPVTEDQGISALRVSLLHALDHITRLSPYSSPPEHLRRMVAHPRLAPAVHQSRQMMQRAIDGLQGHLSPGWLLELEEIAGHLATLSSQERPALLRQTATGDWSPSDALDALDVLRWLSKVTNHVWRAAHYLGDPANGQATPKPEAWATQEAE